MNQPNHLDYYVSRAETSRDLERRAANPSIAAIHAELATRYEHIAAQIEQDAVMPERGAQA